MRRCPLLQVLRLDEKGNVRRLYVKRRDLLREYRLQPRDLRRIDPATDFTKTLPSLTIKENVLVLSMLGIRAIVTGEKVREGTMGGTRRISLTVKHDAPFS